MNSVKMVNKLGTAYYYYSKLSSEHQTSALSILWKKCKKNERTRYMFPLNCPTYNTRNLEPFYVTPANTDRLAKGDIPHMQRLLNV